MPPAEPPMTDFVDNIIEDVMNEQSPAKKPPVADLIEDILEEVTVDPVPVLVDFVDEVKHEIKEEVKEIQKLEQFMDKPNAPIHKLMNYQIIDQDNNDPEVPDFFFSEEYSNKEVHNDGFTTMSFDHDIDDFKKVDGEKPDFISEFANMDDFWFDDSQFDLVLENFQSQTPWDGSTGQAKDDFFNSW